MPLAQVQLGVGEAGADRGGHAQVVVADHALRSAVQTAEERLPVGPRLRREGLHPPHPRPAALVAHRAVDAEGASLTTGGGVADAERQIIEQQRSARRPRAWPVGLEDDRREHLDPVRHQRPVPAEAHLAARRIDAHPPGSLARHQRRLGVRRAGSDPPQRLGDSARDELVAPRRVRPLVETDVALAGLAVVPPGLLARQHLGEPMRAIAVGRHALVVLPLMLRRTVMAVEANPRPSVLRSRTDRTGAAPALAQRRHCPREDSRQAGHHRIYESTLTLRTLSEMRLGGARYRVCLDAAARLRLLQCSPSLPLVVRSSTGAYGASAARWETTDASIAG